MEYNCFLELSVIYLIVIKVLGAHKKKMILRYLQPPQPQIYMKILCQLPQPQIYMKIDRGHEIHDGHELLRLIQIVRNILTLDLLTNYDII